MDELSEQAVTALEELTGLEDSVVQAGLEMSRAYGGALYPFDLLAYGAIKRCLSQISGFRQLIEAGNLTCARAVLRMQLDTTMRFSAAHLVDDPHEFARHVLAGKRICDLTARDGRRLTDAYLVRHLEKRFEWFKRVYDSTSGYVHFSDMHLFAAINGVEEDDRKVQWKLSGDDWHLPTESFVEAIDCFAEATQIFLQYLCGWIVTKDNPEAAAEALRAQRASEGGEHNDT